MDILIFDMDGVLIDVSKSYRKTIQRTIHIYLESCLGFKRKRGSWVTDKEISLFKSAGGFNNDWDLTSGLLLYLLSISGIPTLQKQKRFSSIQEIISYLKNKSSNFHQKKLIQLRRKHLLSFLEEVKSSGGGLRGVRRILGTSWNGWVYRSGDIDHDNLVKRVFQEVYLGKKFIGFYHLHPLFYKGKGYYLQEKVIISRKILAALRGKIRLGIASGRPRYEAELALKRFRLRPYFHSVVTLDECEEEENRILRSTGKKMKFSKPHPYSILKAVQEIGLPHPSCGYVGDVVDDMLAAQKAKKDLNLLAIGLLSSQQNKKPTKEALINAGADSVIHDPQELLFFIP
jgi:HAD superfamily hydrolase (TIGR01548 family)